MKIAVPKERRSGERRVAVSADTAKKLVGQGHELRVESGAGTGAAIPDQRFRDAGATVVSDTEQLYDGAEVVLRVRAPLTAEEKGELDEVAAMPEGCVLIGLLAPHGAASHAQAYARKKIDAFALELMPRITRAQAMDALSSQANLAGYRSVVEAAYHFGRAFPMMMTAAGTVPPARVLVLGAGVAGLQAIATAGRLGAVVTGSDVRPEVKEQVQSLGAKFLDVEGLDSAAQSEGGYAKEVSQDFLKRQAEAVGEALKKTDIAICTALVPGKKAPTLISKEQAANMKPGSVIVDLAAAAGGNTPLSKPDKVVEKDGITVLGHTNWPARIPVDATAMYARNLLSFIGVLADDKGRPDLGKDDQILTATALTRGGEVVNDVVKAG